MQRHSFADPRFENRYAAVVGVHFQFARFDVILKQAAKGLSALPRVQALSFESTALATLDQLEQLLLVLRKSE